MKALWGKAWELVQVACDMAHGLYCSFILFMVLVTIVESVKWMYS